MKVQILIMQSMKFKGKHKNQEINIMNSDSINYLKVSILYLAGFLSKFKESFLRN
jgi:hypothetical protein